jgi:hypothetical protein
MLEKFFKRIFNGLKIFILQFSKIPCPIPNFKIYYVKEPDLHLIELKIKCDPPSIANLVVKREVQIVQRKSKTYKYFSPYENSFNISVEHNVLVSIRIRDFNMYSDASEWSSFYIFVPKDKFAPPKPGNISIELIKEE